MLVCAFFVHLAHETAGAARIRSSLRPLTFEGGKCLQDSGASRRENADAYLAPTRVMASGAKQSIVPHKGRMDCFVADAPRNDDAGAITPNLVIALRSFRNDIQRKRMSAMPAFPTPTTVLDSILFRDAFGTPAMREVFSDFSLVSRYAEVEIALARAEARCGVIPAEAAGEIARRTDVSALDFDQMLREH